MCSIWVNIFWQLRIIWVSILILGAALQFLFVVIRIKKFLRS